MSGFDNEVLYADNVDFSGGDPVDGKMVADGQLLIGATSAPNIRVGTLTGGPGVLITPGPGSIQIGLSGGGAGIDSFTPDSGTSPVVPDSNGLVTMAGSGSITTVGGTNSLTTQLTGLTQFNVLVGAGTSTITKVAPSATSGVPLISQGLALNPTFGTAAVAGGGTGATTLTGVLTGNGTSAITANAVTNHGVVVAGASNAVGTIAVGATGTVLAGSTGAHPSFTASPALTSVTLSGGTALSNYSEGTFTPTITGSGGAPTVTYNVQAASYTRVGNRVNLNIDLNIATLSGGSGDIRIGTLPFTSSTASAQFVWVGSVYTANLTIAAGQYITVVAISNVTYLNMIAYASGVNANFIPLSNATSGTVFQITLTYQV